MKLITIPPEMSAGASAPAKADGGVVTALRRAASETGADFGYLLRTAMRESNLNPGAQATTSSATGLFQFIEQTWLGTLRQHGGDHGMKAYAEAIQVGSNGRFEVADAGLRREILALRKDPATAALMAGEMTNQMRGDMEAALGRGVSAGELYVAHFLGPKAATKLIKAAEANPDASAAAMFPQAAAANRRIFFDRGGEARSTASVVAGLTSKHEDMGDEGRMMVDAAPEPRRGVYEALSAMSEKWRAVVGETGAPARPMSFADPITVMAPVMVQLLAALDPLPHIAAALGDEPKLRRAEADSI